MSYDVTLTAAQAFDRYEDIRPRLPVADFPAAPRRCAGLLDVAEHVDAFILDSFGVLNVGDHPVPGAIARIAELRALGKRLIVLTNAASNPHADAMKKYHRLGFDFATEEVVSSRDVCAARLADLAPGARWGAIAAAEDGFSDMDADVRHWRGDEDGAVDGFLLLSSADLHADRFARLEAALKRRPRPLVVANPDLVAPRETGLTKEPGAYAHELADRLGVAPVFFGKPYHAAFDDALERLDGVSADRIAMVGDTLHTDILGGRAAGLKTVLMLDHGLFAGLSAESFMARSGVIADFVTRSI